MVTLKDCATLELCLTMDYFFAALHKIFLSIVTKKQNCSLTYPNFLIFHTIYLLNFVFVFRENSNLQYLTVEVIQRVMRR